MRTGGRSTWISAARRSSSACKAFFFLARSTACNVAAFGSNFDEEMSRGRDGGASCCWERIVEDEFEVPGRLVDEDDAG